MTNFPIVIQLVATGERLVCGSANDIPAGVDFKVIKTSFIPEHYMYEQTEG